MGTPIATLPRARPLGQIEREAKGVLSTALGAGSVANEDNVISVGSGTGAGANPVVSTRKIVNVKAGAADTDATNLGQVNALIAQAKLGGAGGGVVVPGSVFVAVKEVAGAAAANAAVAGTVALGGNSKALAAETVAIGEGANAALAGATALGAGANAAGANATAIGRQASAALTNATAVGANSSVSGFILCDAAKARCKIRIYIVSLFKNLPGG